MAKITFYDIKVKVSATHRTDPDLRFKNFFHRGLIRADSQQKAAARALEMVEEAFKEIELENDGLTISFSIHSSKAMSFAFVGSTLTK